MKDSLLQAQLKIIMNQREESMKIGRYGHTNLRILAKFALITLHSNKGSGPWQTDREPASRKKIDSIARETGKYSIFHSD